METQNVRYHEVMLELFKKGLEENPELTMSRFCKEHNAKPKAMLRWLQNNNLSVTEIKNEILVKNGLLSKEETEQTSGELYQSLMEEYKKVLIECPDKSFSSFCREHGVNSKAISKWLKRQNITIYDIKVECKIAAGIRPTEPTKFSSGETTRFHKCLSQYREILIQNPQFPFSAHCCNHHISEHRMRIWLKRLGITVKQLQKSAALNSEIPNHPQSVFVQFKPNGGTNGDRLSGVVIKMADGTCVTVEECTVISLCSFITMYNNDQKKNKNKDV